VALFTIQLDLSENIHMKLQKAAQFEFMVFSDVSNLTVEILETQLKFTTEGQDFEAGEQYRLTINNVGCDQNSSAQTKALSYRMHSLWRKLFDWRMDFQQLNHKKMPGRAGESQLNKPRVRYTTALARLKPVKFKTRALVTIHLCYT